MLCILYVTLKNAILLIGPLTRSMNMYCRLAASSKTMKRFSSVGELSSKLISDIKILLPILKHYCCSASVIMANIYLKLLKTQLIQMLFFSPLAV